MRTLFTVAGGTGHFHPLVPVARAMADAGHEVAFAWNAFFAPQAEAAGFRCFRTRTTSEEERQAVQAEFRGLSPTERLERIVQRGFPVLVAQQMLPEILALHAEWPPDLVVSDNCEFAGRAAAESWNIPHATVKSGNNYRYNERHVLVPAMDELRALAGLPPDPDAAMVYRYLHLLNEPPHFRPATEVLPPTAVRLRRGIGDQLGNERRPEWLAHLAAQPTVYATARWGRGSGRRRQSGRRCAQSWLILSRPPDERALALRPFSPSVRERCHASARSLRSLQQAALRRPVAAPHRLHRCANTGCCVAASCSSRAADSVGASCRASSAWSRRACSR